MMFKTADSFALFTGPVTTVLIGFMAFFVILGVVVYFLEKDGYL